jgi:hypothetical protein
MAVKKSIVQRLTEQVQAQGKSKEDAQRIAAFRLRSTGSLKKNGAGLTDKGKKSKHLVPQVAPNKGLLID